MFPFMEVVFSLGGIPGIIGIYDLDNRDNTLEYTDFNTVSDDLSSLVVLCRSLRVFDEFSQRRV